MKMFENAVVGDRVWCFLCGWGTVNRINDNNISCFPIEVKYDSGGYDYFNFDGYFDEDDINQTLFWDEIQFEIPQKPKKKVIKTLEGYANIYKEGVWQEVCLYNNKETATKQAAFPSIKAVKTTVTYEIEE